MKSGAKKKNVWPGERRVGVAADGDRDGGHEQPEQQRAGVAHEDLGRVEVVRQEAEARAEHGGGDERAGVVGADGVRRRASRSQ